MVEFILGITLEHQFIIINEEINGLGGRSLCADNLSQHIHYSHRKPKVFCIAGFATLSDNRRSRLKIFLTFNMDKRTLHSKI